MKSSDDAVTLIGEELRTLKEDGPSQLYGVYKGIVEPEPDVPPLGVGLGRVKVKVADVDSLEPLSAWARVAVPLAGALHGAYFIPQPGTEVLVVFENGNVDSPYVIGSLWNAASPPPLPSPLPHIATIRTAVGNQIVFTDSPPAVTIQAAAPPGVLPAPYSPATPPATIRIGVDGIELYSPMRITLAVGNSMLALTPEGLTLYAPTVSLTSPGSMSLLAQLVRINS